MGRMKDEMYQRVLVDIMEEMQKDFYDEGWWKNTTIDKEPLILGKEEALELGFTIGIT